MLSYSSIPEYFLIQSGRPSPCRKTLGLYLEPHGSCLCLLTGQSGGITHITFTPDGTKILAGGRKDPEILVWDVRNPGHLYASLRRKADTNQGQTAIMLGFFYFGHRIGPRNEID